MFSVAYSAISVRFSEFMRNDHYVRRYTTTVGKYFYVIESNGAAISGIRDLWPLYVSFVCGCVCVCVFVIRTFGPIAR